MQDTTSRPITEMNREVLGVSTVYSNKLRVDQWQNKEVKGKVEAKKRDYAKYIMSKDKKEKYTNREEYNIDKKKAKLKITTTKIVAF